MTDREPLKLYEVDVSPAVSAVPDDLQLFKVASYSKTEAHMLAITSICLGIPSTTKADWVVNAVRLVKTYKL